MLKDVYELTEAMREASDYPFADEDVAVVLRDSRQASPVYFDGFQAALSLSDEEKAQMWRAFEQDLEGEQSHRAKGPQASD